MRWSQAHIPTLRDDPSDAEAISHRLLVRAGYIRQLMAGVYSLLPLAYRVRSKVWNIISEEMDAIGGQQFHLPALHPGELWKKTGRWDMIGDEMFHVVDRKSADIALGFTHEEVFASLATELKSYRQLPQIWYQIQTKFRDEPRPKSGLLRVREFTMKDSYTLDLEEGGLDSAFDRHHEAYTRIFSRLGLDAIPVQASSGAMGGSDSVEFMVAAEAGEDDVIRCPNCDYAANLERADAQVPDVTDEPGPEAPEKFATPGVRTIADLEVFEGGASGNQQIKTLVYLLDGEPALVLLRGDHNLVEQKLQDATGAGEFRPAHADEIKDLLGADAGSLGAVGVSGVRVIADSALRGRSNMTTGANENDFHVRGVDVDRDIGVGEWANLREILADEPCIECGTGLERFKAIEVGHIFKLGRRYTEALGATVLDAEGEPVTIIMGSYGIGLERAMAAAVESHHDDKGITWPMSIAPFEVVITVLKPEEDEPAAVGDRIYEELLAAGIDVILDDRDERPGVKFNDAELVGIPLRLTVGPRGLADGMVEYSDRATGESGLVPVGDAVAATTDRVVAARA
ncbi:MAG: proline--tRNA ligase [Acidimicrobiia bacterium]|nr:proline--tRNA ligase [Acidimicrobiia bacterium]